MMCPSILTLFKLRKEAEYDLPMISAPRDSPREQAGHFSYIFVSHRLIVEGSLPFSWIGFHAGSDR
jgi:hypothetical protein